MRHNRIHQRALAFFLSFALVFGIVQTAGISAFAAESSSVTAYYSDEGLFKDSACSQAVSSDDYDYLDSITQVVVKDSAETIADEAFDGCNSLQTATFEAGSRLTSIGCGAFVGCSQLTEITLPDSVTTIRDDAFYDCSALTEITLPDSVTTIGDDAFGDCSHLRTATFGTGSRLDSIGEYAFSGCTALTGVAVPDSVTAIGDDAFGDCSHLRTATFGTGSRLDSIGEGAFSGCTALTGIALPDSVTLIGDREFYDCTAMQTITVGPNNTHYSSDGVSLLSRDKTELIACPARKTGSYQVPDSVTTIDSCAFKGSSLTDISFGTGSRLASVGSEAFSDCAHLTALTLPDSVNTIGDYAFADCVSLKSITLPEDLQSISSCLFQDCRSLTSVTIPKNVISIPSNPADSLFYGCDSLKEVNVEQGNAHYRSYDGVLYTNGTGGALTMNYCPPSKEGACTVANGTTAIDSRAFSNCSKLTGITLPEGLTTIRQGAFQYCTGLTRIDLPESVTTANQYLFEGCTGLRELTVSANTRWESTQSDFLPGGSLYVVKGAGNTDNSPACANKFYFVKSADGSTYQFQSYTGTKVGAVIPTELYGKPISPAIQDSDLTATPLTVYFNGSRFYSDSAYQNLITGVFPCAVTNVVIGENVTGLDAYTFYYCSSLTEITIPAGVAQIDHDAFIGCSGLQNITVSPDNPKYCSKNGVLYQKEDSGKLSLVFCPAAHTGNLEIPADTDTIGSEAFEDCTGLTSVTIPAGVTSIGNKAFEDCTNLTSVTIPAGVTSIGSEAFENCTNLTSVTIPAGVTSIGNKAFENCAALTSAAIPSGVTEIWDDTFESCTSLTSVAIPVGVTSIGDEAFCNCAALNNVTIPSSVTEIENYAFEGCVTLNAAVLEGTATTLGNGAFNLEPVSRQPLTLAQEANPGNSPASDLEQSDLSLTVYVPQASLDSYNAAFDSSVLGSTTAEIKAIPAISAFETPNPILAPKGAALANLSLPQTIFATVNGVPHTKVDGVTWNADRPYDPNTTGIYSFTAVLPFYCRTAANLSLPKLSVHIVDTGKSILQFTTGSSVGTIDETDHTVEVTVPYGTDRKALPPAITVSSGATVSPASGTPQDFTKPVIYTVTAQNGEKQAYTVTVTATPAPPSSNGHNSSASLSPSLPSGVTDTVSNTQADLSGATMPTGVTGVTLSVTPAAANGSPVTLGAAGGTVDPQATSAFRLAVSDPGLNIIGTPVFYNIKLLDQNGNPITGFSGKVTVKIPVPAGLHGAPHIFRYEESTGKFTDMNAVVENGFLVFSTEHFSYYTVAGVGDSVTLDTRSYQMPVNGNYQIGVRLTGNKAAVEKVYSTNGKTVAITRLKNGNIQVTAKGTGTAYIMMDVYDNKNHLLTHASVKIDVKTGIMPKGDSTRQIGVF